MELGVLVRSRGTRHGYRHHGYVGRLLGDVESIVEIQQGGATPSRTDKAVGSLSPRSSLNILEEPASCASRWVCGKISGVVQVRLRKQDFAGCLQLSSVMMLTAYP